MRSISIVVFVIAGLALGVVGCGSDGSSKAAPTTSPATSTVPPDAAVRIRAICAGWKKALDARPSFPVQNFEPMNPDPALLPDVGRYFAPAAELQVRTIAKLRALMCRRQQDKVDALIAALETEVANTRTQVRAAMQLKIEEFKATVVKADAMRTDVKKGAALDAGGCAFG